MIPGEFEDVGERTVAEVTAGYRTRLADVIEAVGVERVVAETELDRETVVSVADGTDDASSLSLSDAADVLALADGQPDADAIEAEALDLLLIGMSLAVVDVDVVSSGLGGELEPKEIQAKVEGRQPMTLGEYARIHRYIEANK